MKHTNRIYVCLCVLLLCAILLSFVGCSFGQQEPETKHEAMQTETQKEPSPDDPHVVDWTDEAYSYEDMVEDLAVLKVIFQREITYRSIGKSVAGRDIFAVTIGNREAKDTLVITGAIHGRENITAKLVMAQLEEWLTYPQVKTYDGDETIGELLGRVRIEIVPMINPDGVMLSEEGLSSVTDETIRKKIESIYQSDYAEGVTHLPIEEYLKYWKANANGTDLNRNYDAMWEDYVSMFKPCMANYKGPTPASEPETKAMVSYVNSLSNVRGILCMHTQGEIIYWNCLPESGQDVLKTWSKNVSKVTGYKVSNDPDRDASLSDWSVLVKGIPAITVEVGTGMSPIEPNQFETIMQQNQHTWDISVKTLMPCN